MCVFVGLKQYQDVLGVIVDEGPKAFPNEMIKDTLKILACKDLKPRRQPAQVAASAIN